MAEVARTTNLDALSDDELVKLARVHDAGAFRCLMQRHNRRLYRVARAVLRDDADAEDAVQEAYVRAFTTLGAFRGLSSFATWLTRIALNEALGRRRRKRETIDLSAIDQRREREQMTVVPFPLLRPDLNPEENAARREIRRALERAIDDLPEPFRVVFILRDVEELTTEETAAELDLRPETVRTRLFRARAQLRAALTNELKSALTDIFPFAGRRCERITEAVLERLRQSNGSPHSARE